MGAFCSCQDAKQVLLATEDVEETVAETAEAAQALTSDALKATAEVTQLADRVRQEAAKVAAGEESAGAAAEALSSEVAELARTAETLKQDASVAGADAMKVAAAVEAVVAAATAAGLKQGVEATNATMDAAVAAATGVVIVEFLEGKGAAQRVNFETRDLGFELALSGAGLCGKASKARVVVKKLQKGGQAEKLGVQRSWALGHVNGTQVTGLAQARELLAECLAKLPEA